jgi:hypothetical protein
VRFPVLIAALSAVLTAPLPAAPSAETQGPLRLLRNDRLTATFDTGQGGFLTRLAGADGKTWLDGGFVYTDHGLFEEGRAVGSSGVADATVTTRVEGGAAVLTAEGVCRSKAGDPPPADGLHYRLTARLAEGPELALTCRVWLDKDHTTPGRFGFLAALFSLPAVSEWAADTVDGVVNEACQGEGRSFQSSQLPFAPGAERLRIGYADGRVLTLDRPRPVSGPLENVFLHNNAHSAALFLAFLDGEAPSWKAGEPWEWRATLRCEP